LCHKALKLVLASAVLVGSLVPPAFCHAHTAGDRPHSHNSELGEHSKRDEHGHVHDHKVSKEHHHRSQHSDDDDCSLETPKHVESAPTLGDNEVERSARHSHFFFVGFSFSFPLPFSDESDNPLTPDERHLEYVRLTTDVVLASRVDLSDAVDVATAAPVFLDRFDAAMSRTTKSSIRPVDRILLCDSARCERSGVLLI